MYKILIADDHPLFRDAITHVMARSFSNCTVLETDQLDTTLELALANEDLDLILLDLNMPGMHGLNGLITLRNQAPLVPVVIISAEEDKQTIMQAVTYGAAGFIPKSTPREQMREALQHILDGNTYMPLEAMQAEKGSPTPAISQDAFSSLTRRQLLVLERMSMGESNKQIAYQLNIAETTVKAHVSAILRKLGVHNRMQAVLCAGNVDFSQAR